MSTIRLAGSRNGRVMGRSRGYQPAASHSSRSTPLQCRVMDIGFHSQVRRCFIRKPIESNTCLQKHTIRTKELIRRTSNVVAAAASELEAVVEEERFRLHNLSPFEGSTKNKKRVGRGYGAGQGGSCGRGMRGQKSRSGRGIRPGFEGGQSPLYRRLPKLKGIAGNNKKGRDMFNVFNVSDLEENFEIGEEVTKEALIEKGLLSNSGKKTKLPIKILGEGEIQTKLTVKVSAVSEVAKTKLEAADCTVELIEGPKKWTRALHAERLAAAAPPKEEPQAED